MKLEHLFLLLSIMFFSCFFFLDQILCHFILLDGGFIVAFQNLAHLYLLAWCHIGSMVTVSYIPSIHFLGDISIFLSLILLLIMIVYLSLQLLNI